MHKLVAIRTQRVQKPKEAHTSPSVCSPPFLLVVWPSIKRPSTLTSMPCIPLQSTTLRTLRPYHSSTRLPPIWVPSPMSILSILLYPVLYWVIWYSQSVFTFSEWNPVLCMDTSKVCFFLYRPWPLVMGGCPPSSSQCYFQSFHFPFLLQNTQLIWKPLSSDHSALTFLSL